MGGESRGPQGLILYEDHLGRGTLLLIPSAEYSPMFIPSRDPREVLEWFRRAVNSSPDAAECGGPALSGLPHSDVLSQHLNVSTVGESSRSSSLPLVVNACGGVTMEQALSSAHRLSQIWGPDDTPSTWHLTLLGVAKPPGPQEIHRCLLALNELLPRAGDGDRPPTLTLGLTLTESIDLSLLDELTQIPNLRLFFDAEHLRDQWGQITQRPPQCLRKLSELSDEGFSMPCRLVPSQSDIRSLAQMVNLMDSISRGARALIALPHAGITTDGDVDEITSALEDQLETILMNVALTPWSIEPLAAVARALMGEGPVGGQLEQWAHHFAIECNGAIHGLGNPHGPILGSGPEHLRRPVERLRAALSGGRGPDAHPRCRHCSWLPLCDTRVMIDPWGDIDQLRGDLQCAMRLPLFRALAQRLCDEILSEQSPRLLSDERPPLSGAVLR